MKALRTFIAVALAAIAGLAPTTAALASPDVTIWAYDERNEAYVPELKKVILSHVPAKTLEIFNAHGGQIVINANGLGKAGMTYNAFDEQGRAMFDDRCYMELTPAYGLPLMEHTALHEFGHVLDLELKTTYREDAKGIISSEIVAYNALVPQTGDMIPEYPNEHELFAQVHAAVLGADGVQPCANEIMAACPETTKIIKSLYGIYYY